MRSIVVAVLVLLGVSAFGAGDEKTPKSSAWNITETADAPNPLAPFVPESAKSDDCKCDSCKCKDCRCKPGMSCDKDGCRIVAVADRPRPEIKPVPDPISANPPGCHGAPSACGGRQVQSAPYQSEVIQYRYRSASKACCNSRPMSRRCRRSCR